MALSEFINPATVTSALVGAVATAGYQEITRYRRKRAQKKQEKIDWYEDLHSLVVEIRNGAESSKSMYATRSDNATSSGLSEYKKELEIAEGWIRSQCEMFEGRLRRHWAQGPIDIDEELNKNIQLLYVELTSMATVVSVSDEISVLDAMTSCSEDIADDCEERISELQRNWWFD